MKALDLLAITRVCKRDASWMPALIAYQKIVDARMEYNKKLEFLTDPYLDLNKSLNQLMQEYYETINYGNEMTAVDEDEDNSTWCCNEPPDEAGFCPVCREHIS